MTEIQFDCLLCGKETSCLDTRIGHPLCAEHAAMLTEDLAEELADALANEIATRGDKTCG